MAGPSRRPQDKLFPAGPHLNNELAVEIHGGSSGAWSSGWIRRRQAPSPAWLTASRRSIARKVMRWSSTIHVSADMKFLREMAGDDRIFVDVNSNLNICLVYIGV
ncbi:unnamed protein product [Urochloa humidicola]